MDDFWARLVLILIANPHIIVRSEYNPDMPRPDDPYIPLSCSGQPDIMLRQCCIVPPFFAPIAAKECGSVATVTGIDNQNVATFRRKSIRSKRCDFWRCILNKYSLILENEELDLDGFYDYLDQWAEYNPDFKKVLLSAKVTCRQRMETRLVCGFRGLLYCLRNFISVSCPRTQVMKRPGCDQWKEFYDRCRQYYVQ